MIRAPGGWCQRSAGVAVSDHNGSGVGAAGLEYQYQKSLAERQGARRCSSRPSASRCPSPGHHKALGEPGAGLELTIDEPLQYETEQALGAEIVARTR